MMKKSASISLIVGSILILILGLVIMYERNSQELIDQQTERLEQKLAKRKSVLRNEKVDSEKLLQNTEQSSDSVKVNNTEQLLATQDMNKAVEKFFKIVTTYNSQSNWLERPKKLENVATEEVLSNKDLFNDGLDDTGNSIIEALELHSMFRSVRVDSGLKDQKTGIIQGIAHVEYESWSTSHTSGVRTEVYFVTYETNTGKITNVQDIGKESLEAK